MIHRRTMLRGDCPAVRGGLGPGVSHAHTLAAAFLLRFLRRKKERERERERGRERQEGLHPRSGRYGAPSEFQILKLIPRAR